MIIPLTSSKKCKIHTAILNKSSSIKEKLAREVCYVFQASEYRYLFTCLKLLIIVARCRRWTAVCSRYLCRSMP